MTDTTMRSSASLFGQLSESVPNLFRNELDLLRAEINEKMDNASNGAGMIIAGAIIALTALNVLASALIAGIVEAGVEPGWAALIVGAAFAIVALLLVNRGMSRLKASRLAPTRTVRSIDRDAKAFKEAI